jgi:hypothetical protein
MALPFFKQFTFIVWITVLFGQFNCASRGRPGGGPPDRTPPVVLETNPAADSTGISGLDYISILFSERMNESSVENSIFISPPVIYETDWSGGDELTLEFEEDLFKNQTYVITIGSGATDMQKNRLEESYQFAFSTGNQLDRGEIYGKVFFISEKDIFYIYAYRKTQPDSLNPAIVKADFLSQPGPDGSYWLKYLPLGEYRVFVIEDQNKNLLLDASFERIGIPPRDVLIDSTNNAAGPLNFRVTRIDTTKPQISGARAIDNRTVQLRINEDVRPIPLDRIMILDTLTSQPLEIRGIAENIEEEKQYLLYTAVQDSAMAYRIFISQLEDTVGNVQPDTQIVDIVSSDVKDTTHFELLKLLPKDSVQNIAVQSGISLEFSLPVDTYLVSSDFQLMTIDSQAVNGTWGWRDLQRGVFRPKTMFNPGMTYLYTFLTSSVTSLWGDTLADTTYVRTFFTISEDEFGSLSGNVLPNRLENGKVRMILQTIERNKPSYFITVDASNNFMLPYVLAGHYKLAGFIDRNEDGNYSSGSLFPFEFSEPYILQDDTLRIRKRWELSDVSFFVP